MLNLILGAICISFAPIFVKWSGMEATSLAFYRCSVAAIILFGFYAFNHRRIPKIDLKSFIFILAGGLCFAADLYVWHRSIYIVGAGMATILGNTQALYLGVLGSLFLKEKLSFKFLAAIFLAFFGIYLFVDTSGIQPSAVSQYYQGVLFGLMTGLAYAGYIFFLRLGVSQVEPELKLSLTLIVTSLFLFVITQFDQGLAIPNTNNFLPSLLLAIVPQVIGWLLITKSLPNQKISISGLILLLQPVLASAWGMLFFDEKFSPTQLFGALIVLSGICLGTKARKPLS